MVDGAHGGVGISREVDSSEMSGKRNEGSNKSRILVRVSVVLLPPERTRLDVGKSCNIASPLGLESHLDEFGILLDHGLNDAQKTAIKVESRMTYLSYEGNKACRPVSV